MMMKVGETFIEGKVPEGTKLWLSEKRESERTSWMVRASNIAFSVCTKPLNMITRLGGGKYRHTKTVLYTVIDWRENVRGTENLIFGMGAETISQCEEMLERLTDGESEVSHRNRVSLEVIKAVFPWENKKKHV